MPIKTEDQFENLGTQYPTATVDSREKTFFEDVKELQRITPKQGRVVVFDGMYWHTAEQPTKDVRCIINVNVK